MKNRLIISFISFSALIAMDRVQYSGPTGAEIRNTVVILLGFLIPALVFGYCPLRIKVLISLGFSLAAAIVWNFWSNGSNSAAWILPKFSIAFATSAVCFGLALSVNELLVHLLSKKTVR